MHRVVNGKKYDTETAHCVGEVESGESLATDYESHGLYRKKTGEYFVCDMGGAHTQYAKYSRMRNGRRVAGFVITPLSYEQAEYWARLNLDSAEYDREFGDAAEGDVMLCVRVPARTYVSIKRDAQKTGKTMKETLIHMVSVYESF